MRGKLISKIQWEKIKEIMGKTNTDPVINQVVSLNKYINKVNKRKLILKRMSGIFKLDWRDLIKGLVVAVLVAVLYKAQELGIDLGNPYLNTGATALVAYLLKNLVTDENNKLGGKI